MKLATRLRYSALMALSVWLVWLFAIGYDDAFTRIKDNWQISSTMVFGSLIAGATSEGGGAVAFPIFTKVLKIPPSDAKLFSLAIQSVGMTASALLILIMRIPVEWRVILWASLGGVLGMLVGAFWISPILAPDVIKITFTMMASSFGLVLARLNRGDRSCNYAIPELGVHERSLLFLVGTFGGILSSLVGTGIDIFTFSMMVLLFRISEKVATPTSVVLMAINSVVGLAVYEGILGQMNDQVFAYWAAAVPIVVVGAPLGAIICAYMRRKMIVNFLIAIIVVELVSSLLIIPLRETVVASGVVTMLLSLAVYALMLQTRRYDPATRSAVQ